MRDIKSWLENKGAVYEFIKKTIVYKHISEYIG